MDSLFLRLPSEIRLSIYKFLDPVHLATLNSVSRLIATESMEPILWRKYLKPTYKNTTLPKTPFANNLFKIRKENLSLHPMAKVLLEIFDSQTLSIEEKFQQFFEKATSHYMYTRLIFSYPEFWHFIFQSPLRAQVIQIVLPLFPQNSLFIIENRVLLKALLAYREAIVWLMQTVAIYPETGESVLELLQDKALAQKILSEHDGFLLIKETAKLSPKTAQLFLKNTFLVTLFLKSSHSISCFIPSPNIAKHISNHLGTIYLRQIILCHPENISIFLANEAVVLKYLECLEGIKYLRSIILSSSAATQQFLKNFKLIAAFLKFPEGASYLQEIVYSLPESTENEKKGTLNSYFAVLK